ncbi:MAG: hypothetical protein AB8F94_03645 [Saprospiraceae bacterium]
MGNTKLHEVKKELKQLLASIKYNPDARLKSREVYYKKYDKTSSEEGYGYGNSELAFLKWELDRVLRTANGEEAKSEWWSEINLRFIYLSELGAKAKERGIAKNEIPIPSQFWYEFIENPNETSWYKAHNSSIINAYLRHADLAKKESSFEQIFINIVLYRLLFAQAMVEGKDFAFGRLGKIFANPNGYAVNLITQMEDFYPANYPMVQEEINDLLGKSHCLSALGMKLLDDVIIEPEFFQLYQDASKWNREPQLVSLLVENKPAYPDGVPKSEGEKKWLIRFLLRIRNFFGN